MAIVASFRKATLLPIWDGLSDYQAYIHFEFVGARFVTIVRCVSGVFYLGEICNEVMLKILPIIFLYVCDSEVAISDRWMF